ncbi:phosphopentomutase [Metabacillus sp. GX 13764]|uniref:phosphopentomutase n=1 Tax=Metabacillus kandeliae TaxID=2900151 RepID=UPI001E5F0DCD|nr:phosphopentomutase [Metabacillus kandeliae]MCD7034569.1 phosphopentomutase [Metabacillus kandeliae]
MGKLTLFVLDGFGIGAMADCKETVPQDAGAHTYRHLQEKVAVKLPVLERLGLEKLAGGNSVPQAAYGKSNLAHYGADTFMGHQELMGSRPGIPAKRLMKDIGTKLKTELQAEGYDVRYPLEGAPILLVEEAVVVGDNLESQLGNIINVVCDLNKVTFEEAGEIGKVVRKHVDTSRVIVFGNKKTNIDRILSSVQEKAPGQWGVDSPSSGVYGEGYRVLHLGYGVEYEKQFAYMAEQAGYPVYRIGKTADVIQANGFSDPVVETKQLLETYEKLYRSSEKEATFLVNVQETDLAGHKEDSSWYKEVLEEADQFFGSFIETLDEDDLLIITADHGNDPTIGHSNHTREQTPILIVGKQVKPNDIGTRMTMADIAATMCEYRGLPKPEFGVSFLGEILEA